MTLPQHTIYNRYMAYTINTGAGLGGNYANIALNGGGAQTTFTLNPSVSVTGPIWTTTPDTSSTVSHRSIQIKGDAEIDGNLVVKGRDLTEMLETIESRLAILQPNPKLESEFDELKALGDAYRAAEKKFLDQKRVFEILKTQDQ